MSQINVHKNYRLLAFDYSGAMTKYEIFDDKQINLILHISTNTNICYKL